MTRLNLAFYLWCDRRNTLVALALQSEVLLFSVCDAVPLFLLLDFVS